jgi:hypothetical protein
VFVLRADDKEAAAEEQGLRAEVVVNNIVPGTVQKVFPGRGIQLVVKREY